MLFLTVDNEFSGILYSLFGGRHNNFPSNQCFVSIIINVLFLTVDNEFSGILYSLFGGRQNIFLTIFSTKFVLKCAAKILKIGLQIKK